MAAAASETLSIAAAASTIVTGSRGATPYNIPATSRASASAAAPTRRVNGRVQVGAPHRHIANILYHTHDLQGVRDVVALLRAEVAPVGLLSPKYCSATGQQS
jgi:hypothetical protein